MLYWTLFLILLTSAVIQHLNFLYEPQMPNFISPILENSYKVLLSKVKTEKTFYDPYSFSGSLNFSTIFTFQVLQLLYNCITM